MKHLLTNRFCPLELVIFAAVLATAAHYPWWTSLLALAAGAMATQFLQRRFLP